MYPRAPLPLFTAVVSPAETAQISARISDLVTALCLRMALCPGITWGSCCIVPPRPAPQRHGVIIVVGGALKAPSNL